MALEKMESALGNITVKGFTPQLEKLGKDFAVIVKEDVYANPSLEKLGKDKFTQPDVYDAKK